MKEEKQVWYKKWWGVILAICIWPFFLTWYVWAKTDWNKRNKWIATGAVIIVFFVLAGSSSSSDKSSTNEKKEQPAQSAQQTTETPKANPTPTISYSEVTSYQKSGKTWKLIVFSQKPTDEELKKAAVELHSKDKKSYYSLFDDKEKIEDFKNWDINYGKVRDKDGQAKLATDCIDISYCVDLVSKNQDAYPFPKEWADQHELGMINEMFSNGSMKWQLSTSLGEKLLDL